MDDSIGVDGRDREETRYSHDAYTYLGIEVVSPVMRMYMDTYPGDPVKDERDCEEVGEVATLLETRLRSFCSRSGGLHIRVGDEARGFNLDTMRKFMAFIWAYEPGIEKLHPIRRRDSYSNTSAFCHPLRTTNALTTQAHGNEVIDHILSQPSLRHLRTLMDPRGLISAYN